MSIQVDIKIRQIDPGQDTDIGCVNIDIKIEDLKEIKVFKRRGIEIEKISQTRIRVV